MIKKKNKITGNSLIKKIAVLDDFSSANYSHLLYQRSSRLINARVVFKSTPRYTKLSTQQRGERMLARKKRRKQLTVEKRGRVNPSMIE